MDGGFIIHSVVTFSNDYHHQWQYKSIWCAPADVMINIYTVISELFHVDAFAFISALSKSFGHFFSYLRNLRAPASKRMKDWKGQRAIQRKRKREDRKELESFCRWFNNISMHVSYTVKFEFMHFCFFSYGKFKSASNTKTIKRHTWHYYLFNLVPLYFYTSDTFWCVPVHHTDA